MSRHDATDDNGAEFDVAEGDLVTVWITRSSSASETIPDRIERVRVIGYDVDHSGAFVFYRLADGDERWDYCRDLIDFRPAVLPVDLATVVE